jgi:hypothetical protein
MVSTLATSFPGPLDDPLAFFVIGTTSLAEASAVGFVLVSYSWQTSCHPVKIRYPPLDHYGLERELARLV